MGDLFFLFAIEWTIIGTGLLFYIRPFTVGAKAARLIVLAAFFGLALVMFSHQGIPMTSGKAYLAVSLPFGHDVNLYPPYAYFFSRLFPIFAFGMVMITAIGPIIYVLKTHWDAAHR
jgi:hypothetical protein